MTRNIKIALLSFSLALSGSLSALELHVSTSGQDTNPGTEDAPLATLTAARNTLRSSGALGNESVSVLIHKGTYRLTSPLRLSPQDSGSEAHPVTYRAAGDGEVILTGAQLITPNWETWKNGIYRTQVGDLEATDQLFINDQRQRMARYPNYGAGYAPIGNDKSPRGQRAGTPPYAGCAPDAWDASKAKNWNDPTGAFMHGMHSGLWGSQHYRVLGKDHDGNLEYEGGWQNNRASEPHKGYRMIENVFEELDAPEEWFHNRKSGWLYYYPTQNVDLETATVEVVSQIKHLIEIYGTSQTPVNILNIKDSGNGLPNTRVETHVTTDPVQNLHIEGIRFAGTARTFMETIEPLLRGDWCVYRGGAIHIRGTESVTIRNCVFQELGGNAVFIDGYNRNTQIRENIFHKNGASDVNLVGSFASVRDPAFSYGAPARPLDSVDTEIGPKTDDHPADCLVENNLMKLCGRFEKQPSGINISMAYRITVRHNTISHTPRAAININDGTWGGHLIEWNDCFETVLETHDHGAFNGWGRDRYWHNASPAGPNKKDENGNPLISYWIEKDPNSPFWDAYQTSIIRNNRMQCDHGWDIDLDDGCSNYEIYDNLCLSGGLKTREGYQRIVTNNIVLGRGYTCNVPYPKPTQDVFERNIMWGRTVYRSSNPELWGGTRNYNFVHNPAATKTESATGAQKQTLDDASSLYGNVKFASPATGNFTVAEDSDAITLGFKNFPMTGFGVTSPKLKALADKPRFAIPENVVTNTYVAPKTRKLFGGVFKTLNSEAELSATGMHEMKGTLLTRVPTESQLAVYGFAAGDVVLGLDSTPIAKASDFVSILTTLPSGSHTATVWRGQEEKVLEFLK